MPQRDSTNASRIFVSYRREDTSGHVLALIPRLREHFGADRVFKDTDSIAPGQDFIATIRKELESCAVLLAIIGKHWLTVQDPRLGKRRLDDPEDFLRLEVGTALNKPDILVIPVLVGNAAMPRVEDLPPDLANLARRNAIELSDTRWDSDLDRLVKVIEQVVGRQPVNAAQQAIAEARQEFERGRHAYAIERLEQFTPQTPVVTFALRSLREDWEKIKSSRGQVDDLLHRATRAMEEGAFAVAIGRLTEAARIEPGREDIQSLLATAEDAQKRREETERAREEVEVPLRDARQKLYEKDFAAARGLLNTVRSRDPDYPGLDDLAREIDDVEASLASIESAKASFESKDFESTIVYADRALLLDPLSKDARALKKRSVQAMQARNPGDVQRREFVKELEPISVQQQPDSYAGRYRKLRKWVVIGVAIMIVGALYSFLPKPEHVSRLVGRDTIASAQPSLDTGLASNKQLIAEASRIMDEGATLDRFVGSIVTQLGTGRAENLRALYLTPDENELAAWASLFKKFPPREVTMIGRPFISKTTDSTAIATFALVLKSSEGNPSFSAQSRLKRRAGQWKISTLRF